MFCKYSSVVLFVLLLCVISVRCAFDKPEGELCETDDAVGNCVHIYKCLSSVVDLKKKIHPKICSFKDREPIICCIDCQLVNDTRKALIDDEGGIFFKNGHRARDNCLGHVTDLPYSCHTKGLERSWDDERKCYVFEKAFKAVAVGGEDATRSTYPHMALLGYGEDRESAQWLCGGSLISNRFVLTAAHCISETVLGPVKFIAMGILKRSDPGEQWKVYNVSRIISHPDYSPPSKYHDIALLETEREVEYSKDVFPACVDFVGRVHSTAFATGWGKLGKNQPLADNLQEVNLEKFTKEECQKHFPSHRHLKQGYNHKMQMCYGHSDELKDTCEGDSGGPLQITSLISKCLHTIIGVTSYGRECGTGGYAGMYTRVKYYVPWIEDVVWPRGEEN